MTKPMQFGEIPGYPPGSVFADRDALHAAGLHRRTEHGISGLEAEGADAIVLNSGYKDDRDLENPFGTRPVNVYKRFAATDEKTKDDGVEYECNEERDTECQVAAPTNRDEPEALCRFACSPDHEAADGNPDTRVQKPR